MAGKSIKLDIVTPERIVFSEDVDMIVAPGLDGQLGVLADHAAIITGLDIGILKVKTSSREEVMSISGGFLEVNNNKAVVLAETAERPEDIDVSRARSAMERAEQRLAARSPELDTVRAEAALKRALVRLKVTGKM